MRDLACENIQDGLRHYRAGTGVETVTTKSGVFRLLLAGTGVEVLEGSLRSGKRLTLMPFKDGGREAVELIYFLEGSVGTEIHGRQLSIGAGDALSAKGLSEPVILVARNEVKYLYVTSKPTFEEMSENLRELIQLAAEVETRDGTGSGHCLRIQQLAFETGSRLGLSSSRLRTLSHAAYLHDVGNTRVPPRILSRHGSLSQSEWEIVRRHPVFGSTILSDTYMAKASPIVEQHHERLDGSGYPYGLSGSEIMLESSIVAVVDVFDSMTSNRPYHVARSADDAYEELERYTGIRYPRDVVNAFFEVISNCEK